MQNLADVKRQLDLMIATKEESVRDLIISGLCTDGAHHKQWFLEAIAAKLGVNTDPGNEYAFEHGIAP